MTAGNFKGKSVQDWRIGAIGAALTISLGWLLLTPLGDPLTNFSYELPFVFRPDVKLTNVVILYMDDKSHQKLAQRLGQAWDRTIHAQTLSRLTQLGAKAVVFDVLFDEVSDPARDRLLVQAAQRQTNAFFAAQIQADVPEGTSMKIPFSDLLRWGVSETSGPERFVRQHYRENAFHAESLAWQVAQATAPNPPSDPSKPRWINYYGPPFKIQSFSYYEVLSNTIPVEQISNKVVFIGARYSVTFTGGGPDDFRTPYTRWREMKSPGVEVCATAYLNLLRGDWLTEFSRLSEVLLFVAFGVIFSFGFARCPPMLAATLAVIAAVLISVGAIILFWQRLLWFPWLIPVAVQIPVALFGAVLANTQRLRLEKENLERELAVAHSISPPTGVSTGTPVPKSEAPAGVDAAGRPTISIAPLPRPQPAIPDHELLRTVGEGGYGEVWLAKDIIGSFHAVKVVYRNRFKDASPFEREFRGIQKFTPISRSHPGFVNILHVGRNDEGGYFYCIMELGDDETTGQTITPAAYSPKNLTSHLRRKGRLPFAECLQIGLNLSSALQHLHQQQLIHRDIKPSNIIFVNDVSKFADIGLVTEMAGTNQDVSYVGTEGYIAPEGPGTAAADVYSLGRVVYEMCTGLNHARFPELPTVMMEKTPDTQAIFRLNKVVLKACECDASKRFQSAAEMHAEFIRLHVEHPRPASCGHKAPGPQG